MHWERARGFWCAMWTLPNDIRSTGNDVYTVLECFGEVVSFSPFRWNIMETILMVSSFVSSVSGPAYCAGSQLQSWIWFDHQSPTLLPGSMWIVDFCLCRTGYMCPDASWRHVSCHRRNISPPAEWMTWAMRACFAQNCCSICEQVSEGARAIFRMLGASNTGPDVLRLFPSVAIVSRRDNQSCGWVVRTSEARLKSMATPDTSWY